MTPGYYFGHNNSNSNHVYLKTFSFVEDFVRYDCHIMAYTNIDVLEKIMAHYGEMTEERV